ncbi:MAG: hypothetical protein NC338_02000 [Firmicutes bacterium]|nr:hypothetical protein [Bacillota bacterium]MCM1401179.1 hypothetical protein [Bacteroides sp.]MCM1477124.1 hypothetical protein [Bacteroides sp.]
MKRTCHKLRNLTCLLLGAALTLLGYSCKSKKVSNSATESESIGRGDMMIAMYGTPIGRYEIKRVEPIDSAESDSSSTEKIFIPAR